MANAAPTPASSISDALRGALALALAFAVYGGLFVLLIGRVPFGKLAAAAVACLAGYLAAVGLYAVASLLAALLARLGLPLPPFTRSLPSLLALPLALERAFTAADLPHFTGAVAFAGAGLSLILSDEFPARLRNLLLAPERVRAGLAQRPALRARLLRAIRPLVAAGSLVPWLAAAAVLVALPPGLRAQVGGYVLILAFFLRLLLAQLLEEVVVWGFTQYLCAGDFEAAARLPLRLHRLGEEIEKAPPDLEGSLAAYVAHGLNGPEAFPYSQDETAGLVSRFTGRRGRVQPATLLPDPAPRGAELPLGEPSLLPSPAPSLLRVLLDRGVRFTIAADGAEGESAGAALPRFAELRRPEARAALARRFPGEPLWRVIGRRYQPEVRGLLFPAGLLWLPLPVAAWFLRDTPFWPVPLVLAAASLALMLWLVFSYAQWALDESLRAHDFDYLAGQLGKGLMFGELEEAMGSRSPLVRARAVELLLFHDAVLSQGITPPTPGIRKFLRRSP